MKTVWAFEPRNQSKSALKGMANLIGLFTRNTQNLSVSFVVTGNESYLHTAFDVPENERFTLYPKQMILDDLKAAGVRIKPSQVDILRHRTLSTTKAVDKVLEFATAKRTKLLALFTHNKRGVERLFMGSFAETAVHRSRINLLLAGPKTKYPAKVRRVLYASDFGPDSKSELKRVLEVCKQLRAQLTVFHAADFTYNWSLDESNSEILAYRQNTKKMADWIESQFKKARVQGKVILSSELGSIADLALKTARSTKTDLVVVSAKVGPFGAFMGGSVTRNIIRSCTYPILVLKR